MLEQPVVGRGLEPEQALPPAQMHNTYLCRDRVMEPRRRPVSGSSCPLAGALPNQGTLGLPPATVQVAILCSQQGPHKAPQLLS
jgi:hypothetical protein